MATKPNRIQAKQVYASINGVPTRRIQSLDWAGNPTEESVFELGNAGLVEDSISLVETNITMNSLDWGAVDLPAKIFGIYETRNVAATSANSTGSLAISTYGAGGDWNASGNATLGAGKWLQVIRTHSSPTVNSAEYVKIINVRHLAAGYNMVALSPTYNLDAAAASMDQVSLVNAYTITQDTVDANPVHVVVPHRYSSTSTLLMHSVVLPRCFADNLTYRFDTGGASEQNYTLVGEEARMLLNSRREVASVKGSFMSYTTANGTLTFRIPKWSAAAIGSPYAVYADSNLVKSLSGTGTIAHTYGAVTVIADFDAGLGISSSSQLIYYYTNKAHRTGYKAITNLDSGIGKLTKGNVDVYFGTSSTTPEKLQRLTGIEVSIPLTRESVDELGSSRSIAKPLEGNLRNEVTLTFNRNDLKELAYLLDQKTAWDAETLTEILVEDLKTVNTAKIVVYFYNSETNHSASNLLQTMTFENCSFLLDNNTTPITGASTVELRFSTQSVNFVGGNIPPVFSTWF